jgi:hypothetical protein
MVILLSVVTPTAARRKRAFLVACIGRAVSPRQHENGDPKGTAAIIAAYKAHAAPRQSPLGAPCD